MSKQFGKEEHDETTDPILQALRESLKDYHGGDPGVETKLSILQELQEANAAQDTERMEALANRLVDVCADEWDAHLMAVNIFLQLGQKEKAYLHIALALALNPQAGATYTRLAQLASKTISRRTLQRILENGWEASNQPLLESVRESKRRDRRSRKHRQEIEAEFRVFSEQHVPSVE